MSVEWNEKEFDAKLRASIRRKLLAIAILYMRRIAEMFRMPKSGRIYRRRTVVHQASAPGEAPAIDTGALARSVTHEIGETADGFTLDIGPSVQSGRSETAAHLEFGTSKMGARPAWRPALETVAAENDKIVVGAEV